MNEHSHHHHQHEPALLIQPVGNVKLAISATWHCLVGCGLGEVLGMTIGTGFHLSNFNTMILGIVMGFVLGFVFGMRPLMRVGYGFIQAARQTLIVEGLSIAVMETAEVLVQVFTPGVIDAHLQEPIFWYGMLISLIAGFAAAFPVNWIFAMKGIRHQH